MKQKHGGTEAWECEEEAGAKAVGIKTWYIPSAVVLLSGGVTVIAITLPCGDDKSRGLGTKSPSLHLTHTLQGSLLISSLRGINE